MIKVQFAVYTLMNYNKTLRNDTDIKVLLVHEIGGWGGGGGGGGGQIRKKKTVTVGPLYLLVAIVLTWMVITYTSLPTSKTHG